MPFNNWNIPTRLFDVGPVGRSNLHNFIGRESIVRKVQNIFSGQNHRVIFEGEVGTGKTSLGNYIRFTQQNAFSTDSEIMCKPHWGSSEFLLALQSSLIASCKSDDRKELLGKDIFKRIFERNSNIRISNYQGGISVFGSGLNGGVTDSISHPHNLDDQMLISELEEMISIVKGHQAEKSACDISNVRVIFQMNNLDPFEQPFTEDTIVSFLNSIRDILTDKVDASFIINGAMGLVNLVETRIPRLSACVLYEKVRPLSKDELVNALKKRIEHSDCDGKIPFSDELIQELYASTNGNFRKTLGLMNELANHYDNAEPLIDGIHLQDCCNYFYENYRNDVEELVMKSKSLSNKGRIVQVLSSTPLLNVSEIADRLGMQQGNVSRDIKELEQNGTLVKLRDSISVRCLLSPKFYFASKVFFQENFS